MGRMTGIELYQIISVTSGRCESILSNPTWRSYAGGDCIQFSRLGDFCPSAGPFECKAFPEGDHESQFTPSSPEKERSRHNSELARRARC
jgi:hypothetical protein